MVIILLFGMKRKKNEDGGWRWIVVLGSFTIHFIADGITFSFGILFEELLVAFKQSKGKTAWVASLFFSIPMLTGPIAGSLTDRFGCRKVTIFGALLSSLGFFTSIFCSRLEYLYLTFGIISGFGLSMVYLPALIIVACYFDERKALATGIAVAGSGVGTFFFANLTPYLVNWYAWRGCVLVLSAIMLNMVACGMLFRPYSAHCDRNEDVDVSIEHGTVSQFTQSLVQVSSNQDIGLQEDPEVHSSTVNGTSQYSKRLPLGRFSLLAQSRPMLRSVSCPDVALALKNESSSKKVGIIVSSINLLKNSTFLTFCLSCTVLYIWYDVPYVYMPDKASSEGINKQKSSFLVSVIGIASTAGQIFIGYLGDLPCIHSIYLYCCLTAIAGISTFFMPIFSSYVMLILLCAVYGFMISGNYSLTTPILVELLGVEKLTHAYGLMLLFEGLSNLIGPPFAGWLCDWSGSYNATFYCAGIGILLSGLQVLIIPILRKTRNPLPHKGNKSYSSRREWSNQIKHIGVSSREAQLETTKSHI